jgi:hypothetical protein
VGESCRALGRVDRTTAVVTTASQQYCRPAHALDSSRKRSAKGSANDRKPRPAEHPRGVCLTCGKEIVPRRRYCPACAIPAATEHIKWVAQTALGRAQSPEALAKNAETQWQTQGASRLVSIGPSGLAHRASVPRQNISCAHISHRVLQLPPASAYPAAPRVTFALASSSASETLARSCRTRWQTAAYLTTNRSFWRNIAHEASRTFGLSEPIA